MARIVRRSLRLPGLPLFSLGQPWHSVMPLVLKDLEFMPFVPFVPCMPSMPFMDLCLTWPPHGLRNGEGKLALSLYQPQYVVGGSEAQPICVPQKVASAEMHCRVVEK